MNVVGLGGELRAASGMERRLAEAARMGFRRAVIPDAPAAADGLELVRVPDVRGLVRALFG